MRWRKRAGPIVSDHEVPLRNLFYRFAFLALATFCFSVTAFENPSPWDTSVRIRVSNADADEVATGTIVASYQSGSYILTCGHVFRMSRGSLPPAEFPAPISVEVFEGSYVRTYRAVVVDFDLTRDVGLIYIRPGRVLPASPVVPSTYKIAKGMGMRTMGASYGGELTLWSTIVIDAAAAFHWPGNGDEWELTECKRRSVPGRSGGALFTDDNYVAGVVNYGYGAHDSTLFAQPRWIYRVLDRNGLKAAY